MFIRQKRIGWLVVTVFFVTILVGIFKQSAGVFGANDLKHADKTIEISKTKNIEKKDISNKCQFCKQKKQYWKFFSRKIPELIENNKFGIEFTLMPAMFILYILTGFLIYKEKKNKEIRLAIQTMAFLLLGLIFIQCGCNVKEITIGIKKLFEGKFLLGFGELWLGLLTVIFTLFIRKKVARVWCYWFCPLGFIQDLISKIGFCERKSKFIKLIILFILGIGLILIVYFFKPYQPIRDAGLGLTFLLIIISILTLFYPERKTMFRKFKYFSLFFWVMININNRVSGPWCTIAVANILYPVIIEFLFVLVVSLVINRAWCEYACPDGVFFELLSGRKIND